MKLASFDALVRALEDAHVRYLVAGGLAVNAHGLLRFTKDVDLVVQLDPENVERAYAALGGLGYRWIREKGMQVLQFWSDSHPETPVDVFVAEPFDFDREHRDALVKPLGSVDVRFVSIRALIAMKEAAGRPQDKSDVNHPRKRLEDGSAK